MKDTNPATQEHRQRIRERFLETGGLGIIDHETIELLLTYSIPKKDIEPAAKSLIEHFGDLKNVLDADPKEIAAVCGMGVNTAAFFLLFRTVMRRYFELEARTKDVLNSPDTVLKFCRASVESERNEVFQTLFVSSNNRLIRAERITEGTIDQAAVYPRKVIEKALLAGAAALIFVHNHPSGDPKPSPEDIAVTRNLTRAAEAVGLAVHDHLIIGKSAHFSFRREGLLP
jgi:DNA repair protein RadC